MFKLHSVADLLTDTARRDPDRTAVVCVDRTLCFGELDELAGRFAGGLRAAGIQAGDRVTLWQENGWRWIVAYYGIFRAGAIANPVNALLSGDEIEYIIANCGARALVGEAGRLKLLKSDPAVRMIPADDASSAMSPALEMYSYSRLLESDPVEWTGDAAAGYADRVASICYTSGTTGRPKGATLSHRNILFNVAMSTLMHGRGSNDVIVSALPCAHVYGNVVMNSAIGCGATLVLFPKFDAETVLTAIEMHRGTLFEGVPTMYYYMLREALEQRNLSSLRLCTVGGQGIPESVVQEVERRIGCPLIELWGMTEIAGLGTTHPHTGPYRHGSIGVGLPFVETRIHPLPQEPDAGATRVDTLGSEAGTGELMVRGPIVMKGYWGDEAATAAAITPDGWLHTGDVASKDSDGFVRIVDRLSDMILTAGYNVYPAEIERVMAAHPAISMVAVGRLNDEVKGEIAKAYVVLKPGVQADAEELLAFCRERLAAYKIPRALQIVPDLPKTSTGKIIRRALGQLEGIGR